MGSGTAGRAGCGAEPPQRRRTVWPRQPRSRHPCHHPGAAAAALRARPRRPPAGPAWPGTQSGPRHPGHGPTTPSLTWSKPRRPSMMHSPGSAAPWGTDLRPSHDCGRLWKPGPGSAGAQACEWRWLTSSPGPARCSSLPLRSRRGARPRPAAGPSAGPDHQRIPHVLPGQPLRGGRGRGGTRWPGFASSGRSLARYIPRQSPCGSGLLTLRYSWAAAARCKKRLHDRDRSTAEFCVDRSRKFTALGARQMPGPG